MAIVDGEACLLQAGNLLITRIKRLLHPDIHSQDEAMTSSCLFGQPRTSIYFTILRCTYYAKLSFKCYAFI